MPRNYYVSGGWNVICDSCGKKIKASEAKQRWDGLIVCPADFEMRQPQDFVKARADKITVPFTRPRPTDDFIYTQGFFDEVGASDSNGSLDYIDPLSGYFLEDYMVDYTAFTILMTWARQFEDNVGTIQDAISIASNRGFTDSVSFSDAISVVRRFVRTFNDTATISESAAKKFSKALADTINAADSVTVANKFYRTFTETQTVVDSGTAFAYKKALTDSILTFTESITTVFKYGKTFNDSITPSESGSIFNADYIDQTYFAGNNYVGSTYTF